MLGMSCLVEKATKLGDFSVVNQIQEDINEMIENEVESTVEASSEQQNYEPGEK